jgi:Na+-driven multidrug efflux pump
VRKTFVSAASLAGGLMLLFALLCHIAPDEMITFFSKDPAVIAVGDEYLRIVSWNFVASGIIFVGSSMFQAIGNTIPALMTSVLRLVLVAVPVLLFARQPGFSLRLIWYLSVASVMLQMVMSLLLLKRELNLRLRFDPAPAT